MTDDTNNLTVIGRLTKDAELKPNTEMAIGFFTIANNRKKKNNTGSYIDEANFFDVNVYGKYAETMIPILKQGVLVSIEGSLKQERWKDRQTQQNKSRIVITAKAIQIIGGKNVQ